MKDPDILLECCAHAFVASTANATSIEAWLGAKTALCDAALGYAASRGTPSSAELAELAALRRFHAGIVSLRTELTACSDPNLVKETIDALIAMSFPVKL